jgi:hypothetical protein
MNNPFFSVAIPTYGYNGKGSDFLNFSLSKLSSQTFKDFEVVISDHSTDNNILKICNIWKDKINIKHYFNDRGKGIISPNINESMKKCNGEWIKILFQDDFLYDEFSLEKQYNFIKNHNKTVWLFSKFYHSNDGVNFYRLYQPKWNNTVWGGNNTLGCPSGLTIRNKDILFFDENLNWLMDCDYYHSMYLKYGEPDILDEITVVNRTWGNRLTDTTSQDLKDKEYIIVSNKYEKVK